jgi:hypothetical protein
MVLVAEHAAARRAADADRLCVALPARAGLVVIGGEGALVLGGLACAALPYVLPLPAAGLAWHVMVLLAAGALAGAAVDGAGGLAAPVARRQRDHQQPAAGLHRHRAVQAHRRRPAARPGQPEQAVHAPLPEACASAACRRLGRALGPGLGVVACVVAGLWLHALHAASALRCAWWAATRARRSWWACRRTGSSSGLRAGRRLRRPGRRHRGGGGAHRRPMLADRGLRLHRHPGVLHGAHNPLAIMPVAILFGGFGAAAACCSAAWACPTPRCWCCRASPSC